MSTQTQSFLQGEVIDGKYELRQYLGGSERGPVFQTEFGNLRRQDAAIKLVRVRPGNAELQLSRWRMAANLSHPHLIRILDMGRCELDNATALYVVTELADENLAQIIPERALTAEEARDALTPLLDALTYMHARGFVHGRIKPSNIMAVGEELKLSSDSILHLSESPDSSLQPSPYDPPEGTKGGAFPSGDIWSLGMTIVEILTQKLPAWNAADRKDPVLPSGLPEPFVDIVRHCLRREPKNRWTAADIAADLPDKSLVAEISTEEPKAAQVRSEIAEPRASEADPIRSGVAAPDTSWKVSRKYAAGSVAIGFVLITVLGLAKLVGHQGDSQKPGISASEQTAAEPPPPQVTPPIAKPAAKTTTVVKPSTNVVARSSFAAAPTKTTAPTAHSVDLSASANSTAGSVLHEVKPEVPRSASATITGTVRVVVKVSVDSSGNVTDAGLAAEGPSRYFANLSLRAARDWKFAPAKVNGAAVPSTWLIHFGYTNSGTDISSQIAQ